MSLARFAWAFGLLAAFAAVPAHAQATADPEFKLAFAEHRGQLRWRAEGFRVVQTSAKPNGREIGVRAQDASGRLSFLGFLFLAPEQAPMTAAKCRDAILEPAKKGNPTLKIVDQSELARPGGLPVSLVSYTSRAKDSTTWYMVRGFVASGDTCGDLEFYANQPITLQSDNVKAIFASYALDEDYAPKFPDAFVYAQTLYQARMFKAAAPFFEIALIKLTDDPGPFPSVRTARRIATDHAGMSYGMAGEIGKARSIFERAIAEDPDYPMYYYNLACADAEEKKLRDARLHLQAAFERKANVISGESMPDPTKDDSFLPFKHNREFWTFLEQLQASR